MRISRAGLARTATGLLTAGLLLANCGCMHEVKPWQRGQLARADMRWDPDPMARALEQHAHFSKEGTSGSIAAAGGGCGCN